MKANYKSIKCETKKKDGDLLIVINGFRIGYQFHSANDMYYVGKKTPSSLIQILERTRRKKRFKQRGNGHALFSGQ